MKPTVLGVIPARYGSSRFPGKIIAQISGKPMIQRVFEQAIKSELLDNLIVAVDNQKIFDCVESFGGRAIWTRSDHQSGTDRIAEVMQKVEADIVVNIQGDQPLFDPQMINETVAPMLTDPEIKMSTLKIKIDEEDYRNPGIVKVITDRYNYALYFSRSLIPFPAEGQKIDVYEHVGLYVYRSEFLQKISRLPQTPLEKIEKLEQLRVLENGYKIYVAETKCTRIAGISVDTPEDLSRVEEILQNQAREGSPGRGGLGQEPSGG